MKKWAAFLICSFLFVGAIFLMSRNLNAGGGMHIACETPQCPFRSDYMNRWINGYCVHCKELVSIDLPSINYEAFIAKLKEVGPQLVKQEEVGFQEGIVKVWNSETGKEYELYPCPNCHAPFSRITSIDLFIVCPMCKGKNLKKEKFVT